ncbi:FecR family protein [Pedobacter kyonggii]|uniref:FecR family protein n=1 Tax=Pedobacter kyonggii TaxID=1926871 RepID=A0A4Q9H9E5_9SPHI|nr:FecR family protein [Pedobacter kyonggii]TBO40587.1 FecR family protein [Pedobacter kyonggii]
MEDQIWTDMIKRLNADETAESKRSLDRWLAEDLINAQKFEEVKTLWLLSGHLEPEITQVIPQQLREQIAPVVPIQENSRTIIKKLWAYGIAASLVMTIVIAGLELLPFSKADHREQITWKTISADAGKVIALNLPDGSNVWLNAGSTLSYPDHFNSQHLRNIRLSGEAYFEVKHDSQHPFVVESDSIKTTVYGTAFNVRAYPNESAVAVAVNSGKIGVNTKNATETADPIFLLSADRLIYHKTSKAFTRSKIAISDINGWQKGLIVFEQRPIKEVFDELSRRFNVDFSTDRLSNGSCKLTARFENKPLSVILKTLHTAMNITSNQINGTIYVEGGTICKE